MVFFLLLGWVSHQRGTWLPGYCCQPPNRFSCRCCLATHLDWFRAPFVLFSAVKQIPLHISVLHASHRRFLTSSRCQIGSVSMGFMRDDRFLNCAWPSKTCYCCWSALIVFRGECLTFVNYEGNDGPEQLKLLVNFTWKTPRIEPSCFWGKLRKRAALCRKVATFWKFQGNAQGWQYQKIKESIWLVDSKHFGIILQK